MNWLVHSGRSEMNRLATSIENSNQQYATRPITDEKLTPRGQGEVFGTGVAAQHGRTSRHVLNFRVSNCFNQKNRSIDDDGPCRCRWCTSRGEQRLLHRAQNGHNLGVIKHRWIFIFHALRRLNHVAHWKIVTECTDPHGFMAWPVWRSSKCGRWFIFFFCSNLLNMIGSSKICL